jgi:hypothetical protein
MTAQIRTSTFLDAVNHWATATTRLPESAQGNKFNPGKVGIAGRADLECWWFEHSFISGVVGCNLTSGCGAWPQQAGSGHETTKPTLIQQHQHHTLPTVRISQMPPLSAQPLKVVISSGSSKGDQGSRTPVVSRGSSPGPSRPLANPADISSPHELTAFVRRICAPTYPTVFPPVNGLAEGFVSPSYLFVLFFQVEALLEQLDTKFDDMSSQMIDRSAWSPIP